jgi:hypothetical protein
VKKLLTFGLVIVLLVIFLRGEGHAYIDPGAGSNYLQKVLGGLFVFLAAIRRVFSSIFYSGKSGKKKD